MWERKRGGGKGMTIFTTTIDGLLYLVMFKNEINVWELLGYLDTFL